MKNILLAFLFALVLASCKNESKISNTNSKIDSTLTGSFIFDSITSSIEWEGSKITGTHNGTIKLNFGELIYEKGKIVAGKFSINMNSISVEDLDGEDKIKLENHLKGIGNVETVDHFFNVKQFPEAMFDFTKLSKTKDSNFFEGNLTLKSLSNPIKFPVEIILDGNEIEILSEKISIDRTIWNIRYASKSFYDDLGDKAISNEIELKLHLKGKKQIQ